MSSGSLAKERWAYAVAAPVAAIVLAFVVVTVVLAVSGYAPLAVFGRMLEIGAEGRTIVRIINRALPYFFAGCAVAIALRAKLFNIGVEGQYRIAALVAAWLGAAVTLPAGLHMVFVLLVAMVAGAAAAAIPAVLKVTRGVSEVVSSIMLNFILGALSTYLLVRHFAESGTAAQVTATKALPESARIPDIGWLSNLIGGEGEQVSGVLVVAIIVGIAMYVLVARTPVGFGLRASGENPIAASYAGIKPAAVVYRAMLMSGALAGLVGMVVLLSDRFRFMSDTFPVGFGFTGIAVALLGRNNPLGIGVAAYVFAFLEVTSGALQLSFDESVRIPTEMALVMQGAILLGVVVAYELVRRAERRAEQRTAAALVAEGA